MSNKLVVEINPHELACLIFEKFYGVKRPNHLTAYEALQELDEETRSALYDAAYASANYVANKINKGHRIQ